jgi:hypothetical protein
VIALIQASWAAVSGAAVADGVLAAVLRPATGGVAV